MTLDTMTYLDFVAGYFTIQKERILIDIEDDDIEILREGKGDISTLIS